MRGTGLTRRYGWRRGTGWLNRIERFRASSAWDWRTRCRSAAGSADSIIDLPGREGTKLSAGYRTADENYFRALGLKVLRGRTFEANDASGPRLVVINDAMARAYWPHVDPIGKQVRARSMEGNPGGAPADWLTVIGVVSNVRQFGPESDFAPEMYTDFRQGAQWRNRSMTAVVRAGTPSSQLLPALRMRTRDVDPHLAPEINTMDQALESTLAERRLTMTLLSGFCWCWRSCWPHSAFTRCCPTAWSSAAGRWRCALRSEHSGAIWSR